MKITYKNILAFLSFLFLMGCSEDFLEIAPEDRATVDVFYQTENDFEAAIVGLYGNWRTAVVRASMFTEFRADNLDSPTGGNVQDEIRRNDVSFETGRTWWDLYKQLVAPANAILDNIDDFETSDTDFKNRIKGEALFFRGYAYYWMNLVFGGVPLITTQVSIEESLNIGRASEADTWLQVQEDFEISTSLLSATASEAGRVDRYAAAGFLARTLLQQQKWSEASTVLADAYQNSGHNLEVAWTDMWSLEAEKTANEYMLVSIGSTLFPHNGYAQQFLAIENDQTTEGELRMRYMPGLFESFDPNDIRRDETVGKTPNGFDQNNKYDFGRVANDWTFDVVILRFSDIVLMYAEALSMAAGSPQQQSLDLLNMTRSRAGLEDLTLADVPTLDAFVEALLAERRVEFLFEATRFADLKRHGKLIEKLSALGPEFTFDQNYLLLPIPQGEIDKMPGVLIQNPGY